MFSIFKNYKENSNTAPEILKLKKLIAKFYKPFFFWIIITWIVILEAIIKYQN